MSTESVEDIVGEEPTPEEIFYADWGDEIAKNSLAILDKILGQIITISAAGLAVIVVFGDKKIVNSGFVVAVSLVLLLALAIAFFGLKPTKELIKRRYPYQIKESVSKSINWKHRAVLWSASVFATAICLFVIGIIATNP